jgi:hypothetical protein
MLKVIDVNQRIEFVSKYDNDEIKTVFVLKPLTGEDRANFFDNGTATLSGTKLYDYLSSAVVEIKNIDGDGNIRSKLVSIKDDNVIAELVTKIGEMNNMTRQDQKN